MKRRNTRAILEAVERLKQSRARLVALRGTPRHLLDWMLAYQEHQDAEDALLEAYG